MVERVPLDGVFGRLDRSGLASRAARGRPRALSGGRFHGIEARPDEVQTRDLRLRAVQFILCTGETAARARVGKHPPTVTRKHIISAVHQALACHLW